jgi:hypothetical protein
MRRILSFVVVYCAVAVSAQAQARPTYPVTIAISEQQESGSSIAVVIHARDRTIIVLSKGATPVDLIAAMGTYRRVRHESKELRVHLRTVTGLTPNAQRLAWASHVLEEVRGQRTEDVPGIGRLKAHVIRVH